MPNPSQLSRACPWRLISIVVARWNDRTTFPHLKVCQGFICPVNTDSFILVHTTDHDGCLCTNNHRIYSKSKPTEHRAYLCQDQSHSMLDAEAIGSLCAYAVASYFTIDSDGCLRELGQATLTSRVHGSIVDFRFASRLHILLHIYCAIQALCQSALTTKDRNERPTRKRFGKLHDLYVKISQRNRYPYDIFTTTSCCYPSPRSQVTDTSLNTRASRV